MTTATERTPRGASTAAGAPVPEVVELWRLSLDLTGTSAAELRNALDEEELARAARYRNPRDGARFAAGRGYLRRVLGSYLGVDPAAVDFAYGPFGKPELAGEHSLAFNLAHSEGLALLAVTRGAAVGADIEFARPGFGGIDIAERFFAAGEVRELTALPEAEQEAGFLRCWTRKEAYVKAHGAGLSMELDSFEVPLSAAVRRLRWTRAADDVERWAFVDVSDPGAGYHAALVVEAAEVVVRERSWEGGDRGA